MMTRQHFEAMANIFRGEREYTDQLFRDGAISADDSAHRDLTVTHMQFRFIEFAKSENPRFDEARFILACNANIR